MSPAQPSPVDFLAETLALWGVAGTVEPGAGPLIAVVRAGTGAIAWIERVDDEGLPFRWAVRWRAAGDAPGALRERRPRMCGSLVGVLSALRSALDVERGTPVRIAPAPEPAHETNSGAARS